MGKAICSYADAISQHIPQDLKYKAFILNLTLTTKNTPACQPPFKSI